jgi:hypothetical protein
MMAAVRRQVTGLESVIGEYKSQYRLAPASSTGHSIYQRNGRMIAAG